VRVGLLRGAVMLGLFGLLGLLMVGMVGGSIALAPDRAERDNEEESEDEGAETSDDPEPSGQLWDAGLTDMGAGGVASARSGEISSASSSDGDDTDLLPYPGLPTGVLMTGGPGNDGLEGTPGHDTLTGENGEDQLNGAGGHDLLQGGAGNDTLTGGYGHDTLQGDGGADWLAGQEGDDQLEGGAGDDTLLGGNGHDTLSGGEGDDWLAGGMGDDLLVAGAGHDTLDGDAGNDTLVGAYFGDAATWGNYLNGGEGEDVLRIGSGDIATGGNGADRFELAADMPGGIATIMDYNAGLDELVVVYDAAGPTPVVTLAPGSLPDEVVVLLDGQPLASVMSGGASLTPVAIRLVAG
jgi:Ca2+-binding RTX toxin-like protein